MIKGLVTDNKFSDPMNAEDIGDCLDQHLNLSWRCCTPEELLRESLKYFNLIMNIPRKGADNLQAPPFIVRSRNIILYVSNRHTVCGKKQMLYFFLEYIITGKIAKEAEKYLYTIDSDGFVNSCIQNPNCKYNMDENPGLDANAETLLGILSNAKK